MNNNNNKINNNNNKKKKKKIILYIKFLNYSRSFFFHFLKKNINYISLNKYY